MVSRGTGTVVYKKDFSSRLFIFRLMPETGGTFPAYKAGQHIALGRDDAPLTKKVGVDHDGRPLFAPDHDESGRQRIGSVMHAYSIASAPWETAAHGFLEFYMVAAGRLSTFLQGMSSSGHETVAYVNHIVGSFTLDKLVGEARNVVMVGTGTGLAPFVSMIKQLRHEGFTAGFRPHSYTLIHANRTSAELGYHRTLLEIEASGSFDFLYIPTVSRPTARDVSDPRLGTGRATNVLRLLYGLQMKEEEAVDGSGSTEQAAADAALARTPRPVLPSTVDLGAAQGRLDPAKTVILACGNPASAADIQLTAARRGIRCETEAW